MKIYISGAITNNHNFIEQFADKEKELLKQGHEVINPARTNATLPQSTTYEQYMTISFALMDMCDTIYLLNSWEKSKGACIEYGYCLARDKVIIEE